jgi:CubicO group peptidase (beta-lactamase class C family)
VVEYQKNQQREKIYSRSVTKSIVSLAVAKLLTNNKLDSLDTPVSHFYPEWKQGLKKDITVRHLMNQTSGLQNVDRTSVEIYPAPNTIQLGLCASVVDTPGTNFSYNNKATNLLAGIIEKVSGEKMDDYLGSSLFKPLGITDYNWNTDDAGNPYAMSGFKVYPSDLAKLGQLVLQKGRWNGQQLISEKWIDEILAQGPPQSIKYGLLWWRIPENKSYIIDDKVIERLKEAGLSDKMISYAENMKGNYESKGAAVQAILDEFKSKKELAAFRKATLGQNLPMWRESISGPIIGYKASGSDGEYMVIYPKQNIVAVRMIKVTKDYSPKTENFGAFGHLVYQLATS